MTPTEQDKELREKVAAIVEYWDFSPLQDEDSRIERLKNEIMQLILADRKQHELDVQINELSLVYETNDHIKFIERRIAQLQAELEESNDKDD